MAADRLIRARATLQRLSDSKFFTGWILAQGEGQIRLHLSSAQGLIDGDKVNVEVFLEKRVASFPSSVVALEESGAILSLPSLIRYRPSEENGRIRVQNVYGVLEVEGESLPITFVDLSTQGIGAVGGRALPRGTQGTLNIQSPHGEMHAHVEVRYCKAMTGGTRYRLGLSARFDGRLAQGRWHRLVQSWAA